MKSYWKGATIVFAGILIWLTYLGHPVLAQDRTELQTLQLLNELGDIRLQIVGIADDVHKFVNASSTSPAPSQSAVVGGIETYHVTQVDQQQLLDAVRYPSIGGDVQIHGKEVKGFSCVADVDGNLDKGNGRIRSDVKCFVLSK
jgi:hypothetical protein